MSFKFSEDEGRLAENVVFVELMRREKELYYWKGKGEVDFVVKNKDGSLSAINVSYTNDVEEREVSGLVEFKSEFGDKVGELIILTKDVGKTESGVGFVINPEYHGTLSLTGRIGNPGHLWVHRIEILT